MYFHGMFKILDYSVLSVSLITIKIVVNEKTEAVYNCLAVVRNYQQRISNRRELRREPGTVDYVSGGGQLLCTAASGRATR